jgi:hypothetical protein
MLSINSLDMPRDFPAEKFEAVYKKLRGAYSGRTRHEVLVVGALNAITYRFKSLAECDESFTALIKAHAPDQLRYEQERDLFAFFSNVYSMFDAFCFALFAVGALIDPAKFPLKNDKDERKVNWDKMPKAIRKAFPSDPICTVLENIATNNMFKDLRAIREILTHRAVPPRAFMITTAPSPASSDVIPRLNMTIDATTTSSRRSQVADLLRSGLEATQNFVEARVP